MCFEEADIIDSVQITLTGKNDEHLCFTKNYYFNRSIMLRIKNEHDILTKTHTLKFNEFNPIFNYDDTIFSNCSMIKKELRQSLKQPIH